MIRVPRANRSTLAAPRPSLAITRCTRGWLALLGSFGLAGCATATLADPTNAPDARSTGQADAKVDAATTGPLPDAAATPDAPPPVATAPARLLLTEIALGPTGLEFIEIVNPTSQAVPLGNYYITDSAKYHLLPSGTISVDAADVIARFPATATLAPGAVATIAFDSATNFQILTGVAPTYTIGSASMVVVAQNGTPSLTNAGEMIGLFYWDGATDLVTDIDLVHAGAPSASNALPNKSGVAVDGPDGNAATTTYANDANTIGNIGAMPSGMSMKRSALDNTFQVASGSNGAAGMDETSEPLAMTWSPTFTAATPGQIEFTLP